MAGAQTTNREDDDTGTRIEELARPKRFAASYVQDRRSVYWVDREPPRAGPDGITVITATPRVQQLAQHRDPVSAWRGDRPTPIWAVSQSAQQAGASERLVYLAQHKNPNPSYRYERSAYMTTTPAARSASASARLEALSTPKHRSDRFKLEENQWGQYIPVPPPALQAKASERVEYLSEYKKNHKDFQGENPIQWPVSDQALKYVASLRLQQLSRPRSRTMLRDDYDPYKVTPAARKTRPTPRLEELSAPIPRKIKTKKV